MPYLWLIIGLFLQSCVSVPAAIEPVNGFNVNKYLGKWYELARLDHSFERGLERVTAEYSLLDDDGIKVINRGYDPISGSWKEAEGKAYFVDDSTVGHLKVSFFGPFYGSYIIFSLGNDYEYALVTSYNKDYLWLLSRAPIIDAVRKNDLISRLVELEFDTQALIYVNQQVNSIANQ